MGAEGMCGVLGGLRGGVCLFGGLGGCIDRHPSSHTTIRQGERELKRRSERQAEWDARLQSERGGKGPAYGLSFDEEEHEAAAGAGGGGGDGLFSSLFGADG